MAKTKTLFIVTLMWFVACANPAVTLDPGTIADRPDGGSGGGISFTPPTDASPTDAAVTPLELCIATDCPPPLTTCPGSLRCAVDLSSDPKNCGACGAECAFAAPALHMSAGCAYGACKMQCDAGYEDCNGNIDDGCEAAVGTDPRNCGGCGVTCSNGPCIKGKCGCPPDKPDLCEGKCVDITNDPANCGACGNGCGAFACQSSSLGATYACNQGQCLLGCKEKLLDCNTDLPASCRQQSNLASEACQTECTGSNGCETTMNADNCGACGRRCGPGFRCSQVTQPGGTTLDCVPDGTSCPAGQMSCYLAQPAGLACVDIQNDPLHCGGCLTSCIRADDDVNHIAATCQKGICLRECKPGFADCDGLPYNGCEANLNTDVKNCGGCGITCEYGLGQPCVSGQCLMTECDAGGPVK